MILQRSISGKSRLVRVIYDRVLPCAPVHSATYGGVVIGISVELWFENVFILETRKKTEPAGAARLNGSVQLEWDYDSGLHLIKPAEVDVIVQGWSLLVKRHRWSSKVTRLEVSNLERDVFVNDHSDAFRSSVTLESTSFRIYEVP